MILACLIAERQAYQYSTYCRVTWTELRRLEFFRSGFSGELKHFAAAKKSDRGARGRSRGGGQCGYKEKRFREVFTCKTMLIKRHFIMSYALAWFRKT